MDNVKRGGSHIDGQWSARVCSVLYGGPRQRFSAVNVHEETRR